MTFANAIQILEPYFGSKEKSHADFVVAVIGNFITDECPELAILESGPKYVDKIFRGERSLSKDDAKHIVGHQNRKGLASYFEEHYFDCSDDSSLFLAQQLGNIGYKNDETLEGIIEAAIDFVRDAILSEAKLPEISSYPDNNSDVAIATLERAITSLSAPELITPPEEIQPEEHKYIAALYCAYADAEGLDVMDDNSIQSFAEYLEDLKDRRIDYFAAESIRRGIEELHSDMLGGQFEELKKATYAGVKDTERSRKHANGYERLLAVMEKAVDAPVATYLLSKSPYWISSEIKKGACHFLVNEDKLKWVK